MKVYIFGNRDYEKDTVALHMAKKFEGKVKGVEFVEVIPNEDLPFVGEEKIVIMDGVEGLKKPTLIDETDLDKLITFKSVTVHDFDLGFQLKYLKKLGKLEKFTIIGLPLTGKVDHLRIQSILRKLVEQEMQGS